MHVCSTAATRVPKRAIPSAGYEADTRMFGHLALQRYSLYRYSLRAMTKLHQSFYTHTFLGKVAGHPGGYFIADSSEFDLSNIKLYF